MYSVGTTQSDPKVNINYKRCTKAEMVSVSRRAAGELLYWYKKAHRHRLNIGVNGSVSLKQTVSVLDYAALHALEL
jgi:hypothetical protein